jgi:hypothetical protein
MSRTVGLAIAVDLLVLRAAGAGGARLGLGPAMPGTTSRREFVQVTGLAAISVVAATGWSTSDKLSPRQESATTAEAADKPSSLFPWIGI